MLKHFAALLLITGSALAQGGSFGNLTWQGYLSATTWNGRPAFVLLDTAPPDVILTWFGAPTFRFDALQAAVLESRPCVAGTSLYLHEVDSLDQSYEAVFGPVPGAGFRLLPGGGVPIPPQQGNLWEYELSYCTVYEPWNMNLQGPCGEVGCGNTKPPMWAVVFAII